MLAGDLADVTHYVVQCPITMAVETTELSMSVEIETPVGIDFSDENSIVCSADRKEVEVTAEKLSPVVITPSHMIEVFGSIIVEDGLFVKERFWGNDSTIEFILTYNQMDDSILLFYDGVKQAEDTDYTVINKVITFLFIPETGSVIDVQYAKQQE